MVRDEQEYQATVKRMAEDRLIAGRQRAALEETGLSPDEVERAMQPLLSFQAQLAEEVTWYERIKRRDFGVISRLTAIGRLLIALCIVSGLTQRELAQCLGVDESQVSRHERNEYYGVTLERAQRVLDAMNAMLVTRVLEEADREQDLVGTTI
jgi:hypothetical protein